MAGKEKQVTAVRVASRGERGFNCAGRYWPPTATDAEVTDDVLRRIEKERELVVVRFPPGTKLEKPAAVEASAEGGEGTSASASSSTPSGESAASTSKDAKGAKAAPKG